MPFVDDMLKDEDIKDEKNCQTQCLNVWNNLVVLVYLGNQVGLPFNMFVAVGHHQLKMA